MDKFDPPSNILQWDQTEAQTITIKPVRSNESPDQIRQSSLGIINGAPLTLNFISTPQVRMTLHNLNCYGTEQSVPKPPRKQPGLACTGCRQVRFCQDFASNSIDLCLANYREELDARRIPEEIVTAALPVGATASSLQR